MAAPGLAAPAATWRQSYLDALGEGFRRGDRPACCPTEIARIAADFSAFLAELSAPEAAPRVIRWLVQGPDFIGEASLRFRLTKADLATGGHIGYGIRPACQGQGYGKLILRLALAECRAHGVARALVTCLDHNLASARVIEANGGVLEAIVPDSRGLGRSRRYWIALA